MMASQKFVFHELDEEVYGQIGLDPVPFPIRSRRAKRILGRSQIDLQEILEELEFFTEQHPEKLELYCYNIETLAMVHATNQIHDSDAKGALVTLGLGLRTNPQNVTLRVHHALALQINGYHKLAAFEYEAILNIAPFAFDPVIRTLAAKAYSSIDHSEEGLRILEGLAEDAFQDEGLQELRVSLMQKAINELSETKAQKIDENEFIETSDNSKTADKSSRLLNCGNCNTGNDPDSKFCKGCGVKLAEAKSKNFCSQCGAKQSAAKKFCTECGAAKG